MALVVLFTLVLLTPLFKYTPNVALSVIIMTAVLSLIDIHAAKLIWKTDKGDFVIMIGAFFGVIFVSVEIGLLIAVSRFEHIPGYFVHVQPVQCRKWQDCCIPV